MDKIELVFRYIVGISFTLCALVTVGLAYQGLMELGTLGQIILAVLFFGGGYLYYKD